MHTHLLMSVRGWPSCVMALVSSPSSSASGTRALSGTTVGWEVGWGSDALRNFVYLMGWAPCEICSKRDLNLAT